MDPIKDAFTRAKQDIQSLKEQIAFLQLQVTDLKLIITENQSINQSNRSVKQSDNQTNPQTVQQTSKEIQQIPSFQQSNRQESPTDRLNEHIKTPQYGLKTPISLFSTGNEGVPADNQTNQQTDRHIKNTQKYEEINPADQFQRVTELLSSLDELKKEVRLKFKRLTQQEMLVFATLYQLDESGIRIDYPILASKLNLTESSIRDYIQKIIKKGIPVEKIKENNKKIYLKISNDLKKIASLSTIIQLREI